MSPNEDEIHGGVLWIDLSSATRRCKQDIEQRIAKAHDHTHLGLLQECLRTRVGVLRLPEVDPVLQQLRHIIRRNNRLVLSEQVLRRRRFR